MRAYQPAKTAWLVDHRFRTNPSLAHKNLRAIRLGGERGAALIDLLDSLRAGRRLPAGARRSYDETLNLAIARLVLDDVLRIDTPHGFVGGPRAHRAVFARRRTHVESRPRSDLSVAVLADAACLPMPDAGRLTLELYLAHRRPVTPSDRQRLLTSARTLEVLTAGMDSRALDALANDWRRDPLPADPDNWIHWSSRSAASARSSDGTSYKLYISPALDALPAAFQRAVPVLSARGASAFKIGGGAYALCRPDCFVVYVGTRRALEATAHSLRVALNGIPGHGVPFTAAIDDTGLLSWGVDFDEGVRRSRAITQTSWRYWLCERLARFMTAAAESRHGPVSWMFALDRLSLDGIEIPGFVPTEAFVHDAAFRESRRVSA